MFPKLNIPSFEAKIRQVASKSDKVAGNSKNKSKYQIFDIIRKKWIILTPEEWVRQHVVHFLLANNYSKNLMQVESEHLYQERKKRTDILVFDRDGTPFLVVECKAAHIRLSSDVFSQVAVYNYCIDAPFVMITNGMERAIFMKTTDDTKNVSYKMIQKLPVF
ncbi:type I restriction enzyme HsdR N-terminal domain-containing protein [Bernardetia sp.]|uniref:type I restriction enzyme HsdR N-terminal domain-containing protein n=1 Tax=Bernardetia sp. TaxID=1937974 RepID=UPI0025B818C4|nr:type I restriction enzyme HsdR N-terminal domain-containing protein [Bernardetia sp.]